MIQKIPCTIALLTHNSAGTLSRALGSVTDFAEIIICDGNSSDDTLKIGQQYGARIMLQDKQFLSPDGRIRDFAGVRNQTLSAATHDWFFFLDSDEYLGSELIEEIREKTKSEPQAYWVPRKYVYRNEIIDCSVTYPTQQMRLFHRSIACTFIKEVHEKIELKKDVVVQSTSSPMYVPLPDTINEIKNKWRQYLAIERTRRVPRSLLESIPGMTRDAGIAVLYLLRLLRIVLFCRGTRLPIRYELARVWYQYILIKDAYGAIKK